MKRPLHILQVFHSLIIGGTERVIADLTRVFNHGDFRTSVCCLDGLGELGQELRDEGVRVHVLGRRPGLDFAVLSRLREIYREEGVDLVHAHQYTPYFYAAGAALAGRAPRVIFTEHGRHWPDRLRPKRAVANQFLRLKTAAYTAVSEFSRRSLIRYEKMPGGRIEVIYNGIAANGAAGEAGERAKTRAAAGLSDDDFLVLSVGRLDPIKDFGVLIRAFAGLAGRLPTACLWIAGDGDPGYKKELERLIETLGAGERVKLLGTRRDVDALLSAADLFVLSSISEAASMTLLEAMTHGRAIVATAAGGNPELVVDGTTGLLVPVGDFRALAAAMASLLEDGVRRKSMGEAGRTRVREKFSRDLTFSRYRDLYLSLDRREAGEATR